jgi:membrane protein DedA with SNARE-associated domain
MKKEIFKYVAILLVAIGFFLCLNYLFKLFGLPSPEAIIVSAQKYYEQYGYWVVLIGALGEGALFVNWYFPGSVVVALGVVFARQAGLSVLFMLFLVVIGFFATALFNYALGRFGWYHVFLKLGLKKPLEKVQSKLEDKGLKILFTTYIHPNFGALAATAAGILRLPFWRFFFYSLISIIVWNSLWTVVFYYFGTALLNHVNILIVVGGVLVYFMFIVFIKGFKKADAVNQIN